MTEPDGNLIFTPAPKPTGERMEAPTDPVVKEVLTATDPILVTGLGGDQVRTMVAIQVMEDNAATAFLLAADQTLRLEELELGEGAYIPEGTLFAIMVSSSHDGVIPVKVGDWLVGGDGVEFNVMTDALFQRAYKRADDDHD